MSEPIYVCRCHDCGQIMVDPLRGLRIADAHKICADCAREQIGVSEPMLVAEQPQLLKGFFQCLNRKNLN